MFYFKAKQLIKETALDVFSGFQTKFLDKNFGKWNPR